VVRDIVAILHALRRIELRDRARRSSTRGALRSSPDVARPTTCTRSSRRWSTGRVHEFKRFKSPRWWGRLRAASGAFPGSRILANNGFLFSEKRRRRARTSSSSAAARIPLLFLQNISASWVGGKYEAEGHRQARPAEAGQRSRHRRTGPKITVVIGGSFGAGNYGMAGRAYSPRFLFTWPNARISVMGGEQAASVLATVHRDAAKWTPQEAEAFKAPILRSTRTRAILTTPQRGCGTTA
jgi:hypothetical protein